MTISINDYTIDRVIKDILKKLLQHNFYNNKQIYDNILKFYSNPSSESNYSITKSSLDLLVENCLKEINSQINIEKVRILCTLPDGAVFYDSSKGDKNTYLNFKSKSINENHNTSFVFFEAIKNDESYETKYSTSESVLQSREYYYAVRIGTSPENSVGVLRISII